MEKNSIRCCCGSGFESSQVYTKHRETCAEFAVPFLCTCNFGCGTSEAFARHCTGHSNGTHRLATSGPSGAAFKVDSHKSNVVAGEVRLLLLGIDRAGKTTILKRLFNEGDNGEYRSTQGVNFKSRSAGQSKLVMTEVGGQKATRPHWNQFYDAVDGLIYVVDVCDALRIEENCTQLESVVGDSKLTGVPLLILANRTGADEKVMDAGTSRLEKTMQALVSGAKREWHIQRCNAVSGDGLQEGMKWFEGRRLSCCSNLFFEG